MARNRPETEDEVSSEIQSELDEPPMYKVLLFNDDYTTMEFVVDILRLVFTKGTAEAITIMLDVHKKGTGVCGVYTYEVAETKVHTVHALARENGFPLKCTMEKD